MSPSRRSIHWLTICSNESLSAPKIKISIKYSRKSLNLGHLHCSADLTLTEVHPLTYCQFEVVTECFENQNFDKILKKITKFGAFTLFVGCHPHGGPSTDLLSVRRCHWELRKVKILMKCSRELLNLGHLPCSSDVALTEVHPLTDYQFEGVTECSEKSKFR